jgi:hypothetical protein
VNMKIIYKKTDEVIPYENNPRRNDDAVQKVANSIKEFGFRNPIIIDNNNVVVSGHTRLKASKVLGLKEIPCIVADDLTEKQIKAFRIADNRTSEDADWDYFKLSKEIFSITDPDFDFSVLGFDEVELQGIESLTVGFKTGEDPNTNGIFSPNLDPRQSNQIVTGEEYKEAVGKQTDIYNKNGGGVKVICPSCGEEFEVVM